MRFLHTGDWHVGKTIRGRSRMDEFERALDQVVEIALDQNVDAVLHAGDLYEHRAAAPDADKLVFETLLRPGPKNHMKLIVKREMLQHPS